MDASGGPVTPDRTEGRPREKDERSSGQGGIAAMAWQHLDDHGGDCGQGGSHRQVNVVVAGRAGRATTVLLMGRAQLLVHGGRDQRAYRMPDCGYG
jgi:hypothetical protein